MLLSCTKPDAVTIFKSPIKGLFYTVEISKASGLVSHTTRVYAHMERSGKSRRILVLDGEDLTVENIVWDNAHYATICLDGGITDTFRNQITLIVGNAPDDSETIHHQLKEHCSATSKIWQRSVGAINGGSRK